MEEEKKDTTPEVSKDTETSEKPTESKNVEVPAKFKKIVEEIEKMSVIDLHELVKVFEEKFDVSASAVVAAAPSGDSGGDDSGGGLVSVVLEDAGASKIQVIKIVKEITGLGLKEAKEFTESTPKPVKEGILQDEAETLKKQFEEVGAKMSIK